MSLKNNIYLITIFLAIFLSSDCFSQSQNRRSYSVTCNGTTKKGKPCKSLTRCNNSLCQWHGGNCYDKSKSNSNVVKLPITSRGNMKYIKIRVGSYNYNFLIDTGASTMVINSSIEKNLISSGKIRRGSYVPVRYEIADGSTVVLYETVVSSIEIGGRTFRNVKVAIGDENTSLLLGMSFLNSFNWKFNGNILELRGK